uniref:Uncharacterized protein n=1 Tax=Picea sitchensis TaxID=3332 RepID=D5AB94_PICSI|nr:unknown [Picea sitchensis]
MTRYLNNLAVFHPVGEALLSPPISSQGAVCSRKEDPVRFEHWSRPPTLMHTMSDRELLWRASMVPLRRKYSFERVPKIAFMFLTRGPLPFLPLWARFLRGHEGLYSIYVHPLPSFTLNVSNTSPFYRREIPSQVVEWGEANMCDAETRLLANALLDFSNERFILLSETCIPVFNFSTIYNYLIKSKHSFVHSFDDPRPEGRGRYNIKMAPEVTLSQWRKGSQWFEVHRKLAIDIISDTKYYQIFKAFCKPSCYIDEHYIPTILSMQFGSLISNRSITWVDWSRGGSHPAMFGKDDITQEFMMSIRDVNNCTYNDQTMSLCFLFARKFSPSALDPLLNMSTHFGFD